MQVGERPARLFGQARGYRDVQRLPQRGRPVVVVQGRQQPRVFSASLSTAGSSSASAISAASGPGRWPRPSGRPPSASPPARRRPWPVHRWPRAGAGSYGRLGCGGRSAPRQRRESTQENWVSVSPSRSGSPAWRHNRALALRLARPPPIGRRATPPARAPRRVRPPSRCPRPRRSAPRAGTAPRPPGARRGRRPAARRPSRSGERLARLLRPQRGTRASRRRRSRASVMRRVSAGGWGRAGAPGSPARQSAGRSHAGIAACRRPRREAGCEDLVNERGRARGDGLDQFWLDPGAEQRRDVK